MYNHKDATRGGTGPGKNFNAAIVDFYNKVIYLTFNTKLQIKSVRDCLPQAQPQHDLRHYLRSFHFKSRKL